MARARTTDVGNVQKDIDPNATPTFYPVFGKVVIEVDTSTERTFGKLILPLQDPSRQSIGKIVATYELYTSPDGERISPEVSVGDIVLFGQFTGTAVKIAGQTYVICKEHDLLARLEFSDGGAEPMIEEVH